MDSENDGKWVPSEIKVFKVNWLKSVEEQCKRWREKMDEGIRKDTEKHKKRMAQLKDFEDLTEEEILQHKIKGE